MATAPTFRSFVGVAKETTAGTAVTPSAYIPVTSMDWQDDLVQIRDTAMRGSQVEAFDSLSGPITGSFEYGGPIYTDTFLWALTGILGLDTIAGSSPYTHSCTVLNSGTYQPKTQTLTFAEGIQSRAITYAMYEEVTIKFSSEGLLEYTAKGKGKASATAATPTASFTSVAAVPSYKGAITYNGATISNVVDGEITIKRPVTYQHTIDGTQAPYSLFAGPVSVEGKLTTLLEAEADFFTVYTAGTKQALVLTFTDSASSVLAITMTKPVLQPGTKRNYGGDLVQLDVAFEALGNTTDAVAGYSPIKAVLTNATSTAVAN